MAAVLTIQNTGPVGGGHAFGSPPLRGPSAVPVPAPLYLTMLHPERLLAEGGERAGTPLYAPPARQVVSSAVFGPSRGYCEGILQ